MGHVACQFWITAKELSVWQVGVYISKFLLIKYKALCMIRHVEGVYHSYGVFHSSGYFFVIVEQLTQKVCKVEGYQFHM